MSAARAISLKAASRPELVEISDCDISDVAVFIASQSGRASEKVESHLRWFLLENPARRPQQPLGFGLRLSGQLVGCILCSPQKFDFENKRVTLMGSSSFYVDEAYRGYGGRIFLQYSRLGNRWPLFGTSANADAAALWKAAGANPIPNSDFELFGVLHWPPVAEEFAHRKILRPIFSRLARSFISNLTEFIRPLKIDCDTSTSLQLLSSPQQVNDLQRGYQSKKLSATRDTRYIQWRYFSGIDPTVAVFGYSSRHPKREILVAVNQRSRGYRGQISTLNVLDVYPEVLPEEWLRIVGALIARYGKTVDALVLRNQDQERQTLFCERGFQRRNFDAPIGWFLDRAMPLPTRNWYPVPADGDGLI